MSACGAELGRVGVPKGKKDEAMSSALLLISHHLHSSGPQNKPAWPQCACDKQERHPTFASAAPLLVAVTILDAARTAASPMLQHEHGGASAASAAWTLLDDEQHRGI